MPNHHRRVPAKDRGTDRSGTDLRDVVAARGLLALAVHLFRAREHIQFGGHVEQDGVLQR
jgi:hypothetical protein